MSDNHFAGVHLTAFLMMNLLQPPLTNPHATLITLFRNAIRETMTMQDRVKDMSTYRPETKLIGQYFWHIGIRPGFDLMAGPEYDPKVIQWVYAQASLAAYDPIFDR